MSEAHSDIARQLSQLYSNLDMILSYGPSSSSNTAHRKITQIAAHSILRRCREIYSADMILSCSNIVETSKGNNIITRLRRRQQQKKHHKIQ
jgi:hypothetical protein